MKRLLYFIIALLEKLHIRKPPPDASSDDKKSPPDTNYPLW